MDKIRRPDGTSAHVPDPGALVGHAYHLRVLWFASQPIFEPAHAFDVRKLIKDNCVVARKGQLIKLFRGEAVNGENASQMLAHRGGLLRGGANCDKLVHGVQPSQARLSP